MGALRKLPISSKLTLFGIAAGTVSLLCAGAAFYLTDIRSFRSTMADYYATMALVLGQNCIPSLDFNDPEDAKTILASLRRDPHVATACVLDAEGQPLATYRSGREAAAAPAGEPSTGRGFEPTGYLNVAQPILRDQQLLGTIQLSIHTDRLRSRAQQYALITACVLCGGLVVSVFMASVLQRGISLPILRLARAANEVSIGRDYSLRVVKPSDDELGVLYDGFNAMLAQIEARDCELAAHREHLEELVSERTKKLEEKTQEAEAASRAKSEFLANMSHEIRTPLNSVLGFADLLLKGGDGGNEDVRCDYLRMIKSSGKHLLALLNDILDLSKIEAGKLNLERIACSPHEVISQVVSLLRAQAQRKGLPLNYQWRGDVPETIVTDPARLRQLLMNLAGNAIKFTEQGAVRILATLDQPRQRLAVQVSDTGIGIPAHKLQAIFDPFRQADNSVTRRFGGTGLGLAISRHIAEALGGEITVTSEVGKGSTFTATIDTGPLAGVKLRPTPLSDAIDQGPTANGSWQPALPPAKVLVVEDGDINRKLLGVILSRAGLDVTTAENGQVAVNLAGQHSFDVVLMDMQMPVMDGYEATRRLRQQGFTRPILALTAHAMKGDADPCLAAGCTGYLTKPIDGDLLLATLAGLLAQPTAPASQAAPSNRKPADPAPPDRSALVSTLAMDDPAVREVVGEFVEYLNRRLQEMREALAAGDLDRLAEYAHALKGTGGTVGFSSFTEPSRKIEQLARLGQPGPIANLLDELSEMGSRIVVPQDHAPGSYPGSAFGVSPLLPTPSGSDPFCPGVTMEGPTTPQATA